jgi:hypothetical protein
VSFMPPRLLRASPDLVGNVPGSESTSAVFAWPCKSAFDGTDGCLAMPRALFHFGLMVGLLLPGATTAGSPSYEPAHAARIVPIVWAARSYYAEFRARNEAGSFGHSYVTLGTIDLAGESRQTVVAGFIPRGEMADRWSRFGMPVAGMVGVTRSDFVRRPDARFRIPISEAKYYRVLSKIQEMRRTWTTYELLLSNCNGFVGEIASTAGLRAPLIPARFPVDYVGELRALNSR